MAVNEWITLAEAANYAGLSKARIAGLARAKVLASRPQQIVGTRLTVTYIHTPTLIEYVATRGTRKRLKYTIDVPGSEIDAVIEFLAARSISIERRYHSRALRRQQSAPFADILNTPAEEGEAINIDELLDEDEITARLDRLMDADVQQRISDALYDEDE